MKYIDMKGKSYDEHMAVVSDLLKQGYAYTHNTYGNPHFFCKGKEDVCILSAIVTQEGYFAI